MATCRLILTQTDWDGAREHEARLTDARPLVIGNADDADLCVNGEGVADRHCSLTLTSEGVHLASLLSYPLACCNGLPVYLPTQLADGDTIELGEVRLQVQIGAVGADESVEVKPPVSEARVASAPPASCATAEPAPAEVRASRAEPSVTSATSSGVSRGPVGESRGAPTSESKGATPSRPVTFTPGGSGRKLVVEGAENAASASRAQPVAEEPADPEAEMPLVERLEAQLRRAYPERTARRTPRELRALIERSGERARAYGMERDDQVEKFLHCVILLDNELARPTTPDVAYVIDTLSTPNKTADQRISRALSIARKAAQAQQAAAPPASSPSPASGGNPPRPAINAAAATAALTGPASPASPASPAAPVAPAKYPQPQAEPVQRRSPAPSAVPMPWDSPPPGNQRQPAETVAPPPPVMPRPAPISPHRPLAAIPALHDVEDAASTLNSPPPAVEELRGRSGPMAGGAAASVAGAGPTGLPDIEGFRIIEQIASGGMGTVFRAVDLQLDIEVAIKVLRSIHPAAQQQFLQEARAAAKLQHPNIVPVLRYERYGQGGYFVMQLIRGKDAYRLSRAFADLVAHTAGADRILAAAEVDPVMITPELRALTRESRPYYRIVGHWLAGVADGLDRAHADGIVHYDVKPSNLMLAADGRMMLGDFGLATLGERQASAACIGTPAYLSPEMLAGWASRAGSAETDLRVDIWGLGLSLYELLTYRPAYDGSLGKVLRAIATLDPPPPREVVWDVPEELERICLRAIARNPEHRYSRAGEMADDLRAWVNGPDEPRQGGGVFGWFRRKE